MIFDIEKDVIIIDLYEDIQIFFIFVNHRSRIRATIFNNNSKKIIISLHFNIIISIIDLKCRFSNCYMIAIFFFESQKLDILLIYAYIVNYNILKVFIKNDINYIYKFITQS